MTIISLIAAVDENYGLGKDNRLLCHLPADLKNFKRLTIHKPLIMGRKTFESIGKALPERRNIVLSTQKFQRKGIEVVGSLNEAFALANSAPEVMIIGGASLYQQTLSIAFRIYLTRIHHVFPADSFFPPLDLTIWKCKESFLHPKDTNNKYDFGFYLYER